MGAECSKNRQPMRAILALSRAQLLLIVVTRSRDLSRECHVTKHKRRPRVTSQCPISKILGPFNSVHRDLQVEGCASKILKKGRTLTIHTSIPTLKYNHVRHVAPQVRLMWSDCTFLYIIRFTG